MDVCIYVCVYVRMYMYGRMPVRMYVCMYVCIYYSLYLTLKSINQSQRVSSNFWGRCNSNCEKIITFIIAAHKSMQFRSVDRSDNVQTVLQAWLRLDLWSGQRFFLLPLSILAVSALSILPVEYRSLFSRGTIVYVGGEVQVYWLASMLDGSERLVSRYEAHTVG